jgi:hypothetical protein
VRRDQGEEGRTLLEIFLGKLLDVLFESVGEESFDPVLEVYGVVLALDEDVEASHTYNDRASNVASERQTVRERRAWDTPE